MGALWGHRGVLWDGLGLFGAVGDGVGDVWGHFVSLRTRWGIMGTLWDIRDSMGTLWDGVGDIWGHFGGTLVVFGTVWSSLGHDGNTVMQWGHLGT